MKQYKKRRKLLLLLLLAVLYGLSLVPLVWAWGDRLSYQRYVHYEVMNRETFGGDISGDIGIDVSSQSVDAPLFCAVESLLQRSGSLAEKIERLVTRTLLPELGASLVVPEQLVRVQSLHLLNEDPTQQAILVLDLSKEIYHLTAHQEAVLLAELLLTISQNFKTISEVIMTIDGIAVPFLRSGLYVGAGFHIKTFPETLPTLLREWMPTEMAIVSMEKCPFY